MKKRTLPSSRPTLLEPSSTMQKRIGFITESPRLSRRWLFAAVLGLIVLIQLLYSYSFRQTDDATADWYQARRSVRDQARQDAKTTIERTCHELADKFDEPYSELYMDRKLDLEGPMYALYRWDTKITKSQLSWQRNLTENRNMPHNTRIFFKVKDSLLYVDQSDIGYQKVFPMGSRAHVNSLLLERYEQSVELILLAIEIYDIPNVDFVLELEDFTYDTAPEWDPVLTFSLRHGAEMKGFTFPSGETYANALGTYQMLYDYECLEARYPLNKREKKAVWRGSTTGPPINLPQDVESNKRVALSSLSMKRPDILDAGIVNYVQVDMDNQETKSTLEKMAPLKSRMNIEHFNNFVAVIDLDGNAWSERFPRLLEANTPILKQEYTHWDDYFAGRLTDKKGGVILFKDDLSDLVSKVEDIIVEYDHRRWSVEKRRAQMLDFALDNVSQLGVIRAAAYAISKFASFEEWAIEEEEKFVLIPAATCCKVNSKLPSFLLRKMNPDYQS
eukprot:g7038.t1